MEEEGSRQRWPTWTLVPYEKKIVATIKAHRLKWLCNNNGDLSNTLGEEKEVMEKRSGRAYKRNESERMEQEDSRQRIMEKGNSGGQYTT